MTDLSIDGITLSSLGFFTAEVNDHIVVGSSKIKSPKELYNSVNYSLSKTYQESPEPSIKFFGRFSSLQSCETAFYTLLGILVQPGEKTFIHTDSAGSITFKGIMHKGVKSDPVILRGDGEIFIQGTLKTLKTND